MRHPSAAITETRVAIPGPAPLSGTLIAPPDPGMAVIVNPATGVPAAFYHPFARWLAETRNAMVLCWDYRDFGASGDPRRSRATMTDWAIHDPTAARTWLEQRAQGLPLWAIGHSLGGMALAFQPGLDRLERIVTVSAGAGHHSDQPWPWRGAATALWYALGPATTTTLGYLPGHWLGLGNPLPKGVFWQWRGWLLRRGNMAADPRIGALTQPGFTGPLSMISIEDDWMIPPPAVARMAAWHPKAQITHTTLSPSDFGLKSIGHIHPFARRNQALWPALIA